MSQAAFVLRIAPSGIDKVDEAISTNQLIIGWADAEGLLNLNLTWEQFREIIRTQYHADEANLRRAGAAAGHMWRFIRDMKPGDLIVVPHWANFLVAEVTGPAIYDVSKVADDSAYRRPVRWLTNKNGITRRLARSALQSRMKTQGSSADATDLIPHIRECLQLVAEERAPTFATDLQARLIRETLDELRSGRINDLEFEKLIEVTLRNLGADNVQIVPRSKDKGADLIATFRIAGTFQQRVAVQAKYWRPDPPLGRAVVQQLINGIEAEGASLGMVVTTGVIAGDAVEAAEKYFENRGIRIELVDGEQFAKLIVEHGAK